MTPLASLRTILWKCLRIVARETKRLFLSRQSWEMFYSVRRTCLMDLMYQCTPPPCFCEDISVVDPKPFPQGDVCFQDTINSSGGDPRRVPSADYYTERVVQEKRHVIHVGYVCGCSGTIPMTLPTVCAIFAEEHQWPSFSTFSSARTQRQLTGSFPPSDEQRA